MSAEIRGTGVQCDSLKNPRPCCCIRPRRQWPIWSCYSACGSFLPFFRISKPGGLQLHPRGKGAGDSIHAV